VRKVSKAKKKETGWAGEKIKSQNKTEIRAEKGLRKGKQKKSTCDGTRIEKRILSVHHPSTSVYWWVPVHSGPVLGAYFTFNNHRFLVFEKNQNQRTIGSGISKPSKNC
jgi:hypothetical protein